MSKAFDCINRVKLLAIMQPLISPSNFQILKFLITETTLTTKIRGEYGTPFSTSIGTPQGDALSPILFVIYLEAADREAYDHLLTQHGPEPPGIVYFTPKYADDVDHIRYHIDPAQQQIAARRNQDHLNSIEIIFQPQYNIKINTTKTEYIHLSAERLQSPAVITANNRTHQTNVTPITNKKLGSKIEPHQDIIYRISQAQTAFYRLTKIWQRYSLISAPTRIRIFQTCISSILTYNLSSLGVTESGYDKIDAFHRTKLRLILGIRHPKHIRNSKLYKVTKTAPISTQIHTMRWKLFGHILRGHPHAPAMEFIHQYLNMQTVYQRRTPGKPPNTIVTVLNQDLRHAHFRYPQTVPIAKLQDINDLTALRQIANNRSRWIQLWNAIAKDRAIRKEEEYNRNRNKRKARELIRQALPQRLRRITYTPLAINVRRLRTRRRRRLENDPMTEHPEYNQQRLRHADRDFVAAHSFSESRRL